MTNVPIFSYRFTIPAHIIDENGHVNNVAYVQWMQGAALRHPEAVGYKPPESARMNIMSNICNLASSEKGLRSAPRYMKSGTCVCVTNTNAFVNQMRK